MGINFVIPVQCCRDLCGSDWYPGPAPKFRPVLRRDELPPEVLDLEGFSDILSNYYTEQNIGQLWRDVQPLYQREIERLHDPVVGHPVPVLHLSSSNG